MILKVALDKSAVLSFFRHLYKLISYLNRDLKRVYHNSQTYKVITRFGEKTNLAFKYSFFGRISESKQKNSVFFNQSRTIQFFINSYKKWKDKIIHSFKASSTIDMVKNTSEQLNFSPTKILGLIGVAAISVNVFLSLVLQKQIGLWGWIIRGLFLFVSVSGLICMADWQTIKKSSIFLKKL